MSARTPGHRHRPARERHLALIQGLPADLGCGAACLCPAVAGVPAGMLRALLAELNACGMRPAGMTLTRLRATFVFPTGLVACCCGTWLMWTTGRISARAARCTRSTAAPMSQPRPAGSPSGGRSWPR